MRQRYEKALQNDIVDQIERNKVKRNKEDKKEAMWAEQWENDRKVREDGNYSKYETIKGIENSHLNVFS